jgi:nucleoid DNA-binding protein
MILPPLLWKRHSTTIAADPALAVPAANTSQEAKPIAVTIPRRPRAAKTRAFSQVISDVARACHYSESDIAFIASSVIEGIAAQIAEGRIVHILGFGQFGSRWFRRRGRPGQAVPVFRPSRGLRQQVRFELVSEAATANDAIMRFGRRNRCGTVSGREHQTTRGAQERLRAKLLRDSECSIDLE